MRCVDSSVYMTATKIDAERGQRIRQARLAAGFSTQRALAEHLGITGQTIHRFEKGISRPDPEILFPMAEALRVDPSYLLHGNQPGPDVDPALLERMRAAVQGYLDSWAGQDTPLAIADRLITVGCIVFRDLTTAPTIEMIHDVRNVLEKVELFRLRQQSPQP